ncbi:hypothetical protein GCM10027180_25930 [Microbulbifer echini]
MAEIFIEQRNDTSGRFAIIEENESSAWLYLTPTSGKGIDRDAFIYSPIEPADKLNIDEIKDGGTPILTKSVASESAVLNNIGDSELSIKWSKDGHSVAVFYKNEAIAFIAGKEKSSYSKALSKESFFGKPWDQNVYRATFE